MMNNLPLWRGEKKHTLCEDQTHPPTKQGLTKAM